MADAAGNADLRPKYDFSRGVQGRHVDRQAAGTNVVVLDPDKALLRFDFSGA